MISRGDIGPAQRRTGSAIAGPGLILLSVLIVMRGFAFGDVLSSQHVDLLPMWLPTFSFLGRTLASGHIPAWNPYAMGGVPFAADPQSGWTYLPAMLLFSAFPSDVGMRAFIVLQPALVGLGIYWFLRSESLSRPASTLGGLCLALAMANSVISLSLPFAGTLAWSALLLAAASRVVHAKGWSGRLLWVAGTASCWGQLADAHLSNGLVMGSAALFIYLSVALVHQTRQGVMSRRDATGLAAIATAALPLVNLAVLLPRLAYLPSTTLGLGYGELNSLAAKLAGSSTRGHVVGFVASPSWPSSLAMPPGPYLGVLAVVLSLGWWRKSEHRWLCVPLAIYSATFYLLSLGVVARTMAPFISGTPWGQFYLHEPYRFTYAILFGICLLAGFGAAALLKAKSVGASLRIIAPGTALWAVMWLIATPKREPGLVLLGIGMIVASVTLLRRSPRYAWLLPAVTATEMVLAGLVGQGAAYALDHQTLRPPTVHGAAYLAPNSIASYLNSEVSGGGRYVSYLPDLGQDGLEGYQSPEYWGLLAGQRSMLFGLADADGYNPIQLVRYWTFVRTLDPKPIRYNAAFLSDPSRVLLDLLGIRWIVTRGQAPGWAGAFRTSSSPALVPLRADGSWQLYPIPGAAPQVSVVSRWTVVSTPESSLSAVRSPGFDPESEVVLERQPGISGTPGSAGGSATYSMTGEGAATVSATADAPSVLLVRIPYERNWHASVDGRPTQVLPADYLDMGVPLTGGRHTVRLFYDDPTIGYGLLGSALSLLALLSTAVALRRRESRPA